MSRELEKTLLKYFFNTIRRQRSLGVDVVEAVLLNTNNARNNAGKSMVFGKKADPPSAII